MTVGADDDPIYEDDHDTDENTAQMTKEQLVHSNMVTNFKEIFIECIHVLHNKRLSAKYIVGNIGDSARHTSTSCRGRTQIFFLSGGITL